MSAEADKILRVDDVRRHFGGLHAVDGVTFDVDAGRMVGIIGPNGAGKSTLFDLIAGAQPADEGKIHLEAVDVTHLPGYRRARLGIGRTFQQARPIARLSVLENMLLAPTPQLGEAFWAPLLAADTVRAGQRALRERALDLLTFFNLADLQDEFAGALSGGQKKLLELARALMAEPRLMLLDEPMAGVNPTLARKLMDQIETLQRERGITFLLVEHDLETVYQRCDPILVMANGRLIAQGSADEIRENRSVVDAYLGGATE